MQSLKIMRLFLLALVLVSHSSLIGGFGALGVYGQGKASKEVLTNATVIELVKLGLGDNVILEKIRQSECRFDTSVEGLKQLKAAHVSDALLQAMLSVPSAAASSNAQPLGQTGFPVTPPTATLAQPRTTATTAPAHEPGIYLQEPTGLREINPTVFSGTKGSYLGAALTYGIKKSKIRASVRGASANTVVAQFRPTFYFYFDSSLAQPGMAMSGLSFFGASSPGEFVLVKMERKDNSREAVLMEFSAFGSSTGARDKDIQDFAFEKVQPGVFKVTPKANLEPGEYCFYYAGTPMGLGMAGGKLFDFSVRLPAM